MKSILLEGTEKAIDSLLKKERIWLKRHGVNVISDKKPERKKRSPNKSHAEKLENETNKK